MSIILWSSGLSQKNLYRHSTFNHIFPNDQILRDVSCCTMNERITENIVRDILNTNQKQYSKVTIEEQKSENKRIEKLLKNASKQGDGTGKPEFIITFDEIPDLVIVIECKADIKKHESKNRDKPKDFAVDGVLLYSEYLAKEFDVVSIAVSGQKKSELKVSTFLQLQSKKVMDKQDIDILKFEDYILLYKKDPEKEKNDISKLMKYSKKLHNDLRDNAKLSEPEKPLLISGILIALTDDSFRASYSKKKTSKSLATLLVTTIKEVLIAGKLDENKRETMLYPYQFIKVHPELTKEKDNDGKSIHLLHSLIHDIELNVLPFADSDGAIDILGQFYGEFLRYTGGDKKGLGIVLTPKHITELFVDIANVNKDDIIFDNCCGTASFLISAMKKMTDEAGNDESKKKRIKETQLIGIEQQSNMFALACANMILRGDGKTHIYQKNCFSMTETILEKHKCTVGFLNPPYSQKGEGLHELNFVSNCLDSIEKNGIVVAIVPISCATTPTTQKGDLLEKHTLEAVMSMPNELFNPVGIITCIMVFRAKVPHDPKKSTWFGFWKNDEFEKTKHEGRIDKYGKWKETKNKWIENYRERKEIPEECVLHKVTAEDEWVAEAYMKTDYSNINSNDFLDMIKKYTIFKIQNEEMFDEEDEKNATL